jgi:hypothetical protein
MACVNHPDLDETRACTSCAARWCSDCVQRIGYTHRYTCPACGHGVVPAAPAQIRGGALADIARRVISLEGLTTAAAFTVPFALSRWFQILIVLYLSALVGYYFTIIQHVGDGQDGLPGPSDATEDWIEVVGYALRGVACAALGFAPLIAWFAIERRLPSAELAVVLVVAGQLYMPAMLLAVTFSNSIIGAVWPVAWVRVIARAPLAYARFTALWLASAFAGVVIYVLTAIAFADFGVFGWIAAALIWNLFWFAQAVLVGQFLRTNREAFGWGV